MKKFTMTERDEVVTLNNWTFPGWITKKECPACSESILYHKGYDADFCPSCNTWNNQACQDPSCHFCSSRPLHPLPQNP